MKENYCIFIRRKQKVICKDGVIHRLFDGKNDEGVSEGETVIELYGPLKIPNEVPYKIAKLLIKKKKAYELHLLQFEYIKLYEKLKTETDLSEKEIDLKIIKELRQRKELMEHTKQEIEKLKNLGKYAPVTKEHFEKVVLRAKMLEKMEEKEKKIIIEERNRILQRVSEEMEQIKNKIMKNMEDE